MKNILWVLLLMVSFKSFAQADTISTAQVKQYMDKEVVLKGKLMGMKPYTDRNGKEIMFLDIDETYPNTVLGVTIFPEALLELKITKEDIGKTIFISGMLLEHKGKPNLTINEPSQISWGGVKE